MKTLCIILSFIVLLAACGQVNHAEKERDSLDNSGRQNVAESNSMAGYKAFKQNYIVELEIPNFDTLSDSNKAQAVLAMGLKLSTIMQETDFELVHSYELLPAILISIDQKYLTTLKQDKFVKSVTENGVSKLQPISIE